MTKKELLELAEKYDRKQEKAFRSYMETGISRYEREARNAEDIADTCRLALAAADDHEHNNLLRFKISQWAAAARLVPKLVPKDERGRADALLCEIVEFAVMQGMLRREE